MIELNDIQRSVQQTFREFADRRVRPQAAAIDREARFPMELFREAGALGFFGMRYPQEVGGTDMDAVSYNLAVMELARGSLSLAASCTMQSLMGTYFLHRFGDAGIREAYLVPAIRGERIGGICMTEPDAGSDLMSVSTTARPTGGGFVLNGRKTWVTSAPVADFFTVLARTEGHEGLSLFFVPSGSPGVTVGRDIGKMGVRGSPTSEVGFTDVVLPVNHLLGGIGQGTRCLHEILAEIRIMTASLAVGVATAAFDDALEYARTRVQFGKAIGTFQAVRTKFAGMAMRLETARLFTLHAATLRQDDTGRARQAMIAKLHASECANAVCDEASRVMASYGYATDHAMERYLRDARFTLIGGGTSEILQLNIAKELGL